jgi:hypothetical protein
MNDSAPLSLLPEDKLDALRYLDEFHFWYSLDDQRRCRRCHRVLTGRQVEIQERPGTRGRMLLRCPTAGCISTPDEWVYVDAMEAASQKTPSSRLPGNARDMAPRAKQAGRKDAGPGASRRRFASLRAALIRRSKGALVTQTMPPAPDPLAP